MREKEREPAATAKERNDDGCRTELPKKSPALQQRERKGNINFSLLPIRSSSRQFFLFAE